MGRNPSEALDSTLTTATQPVYYNSPNSLDCPAKYGTQADVGRRLFYWTGMMNIH